MDQSSPAEASGTSCEMEVSSSINRMPTEEEDTGMTFLEAIFLHYRSLKVIISNAIKTPFPFLEVLRDKGLITDKMYNDFKDSCTNLVPVQNVVYRALEELENKFDLQVLRVLFCMEHMKAYSDLEPIFKYFQNVIPENELRFEQIDRGDLNLQQILEQGPRIPIVNNMALCPPELPVTCGNATGILYVEKYVQGIYEKSIQMENGEWLTLREFEIRGDRERSKNWRQSIRSGGKTLGNLIKEGRLPESPRKGGQRENSTNRE